MAPGSCAEHNGDCRRDRRGGSDAEHPVSVVSLLLLISAGRAAMTEVTARQRADHAVSGRAPRRPAGPAPLRSVAGCLPDGTPFYAPVGEVVTDGDLVVCHLCGRLLHSVTAHLRGHRWTKEQYCAAFGLEQRQSLEGSATRK